MPRKSRRCLRVRKLRLNSLKPLALRTKSCWRLWNALRRGFTCRGRGGALSSASPLQFPCNHHLRHLTEVRWEPRPQSDRTYDDFWYRFIKTALLMVRTRGLLGGFLEPPWSSGYSGLQILGKSDRSLSGPLHATVGRASIAPLALEGHL